VIGVARLVSEHERGERASTCCAEVSSRDSAVPAFGSIRFQDLLKLRYRSTTCPFVKREFNLLVSRADRDRSHGEVTGSPPSGKAPVIAMTV